MARADLCELTELFDGVDSASVTRLAELNPLQGSTPFVHVALVTPLKLVATN